MIIEKKKIADLIPAPYNPRQSTAKQEKHLKESLMKFGLVEPIIFNKQTGYIVGGHFRVRELKKLGIKEVECVIVDLNEADEKELNIRLNANTGSWDWDTLANDWEVVDLEAWGLEIPNFDEEPEQLEASEDDYDVPEGGMETDIVIGDLFEIGEHRLLCGDSTDSDAVARLMNGEKADMVFTDPPYFSKQNLVREATSKALIKGSLMGKDSMFAKIYDFDEGKVISTLNTLFLFSNVNTYFCCSQEQVVFYLKYAENLNLLYNILIWRKPNNVINKDRFSSSIEYIIRIYDKKNAGLNKLANNDYYDKVKEISRYIPKDEKNHHTQKPLELCSQFVKLSSNIKELLYEPFCGSGSTMVAAHQLKRRCFGMELEPKYCAVIIERMKKLDPTLIIKRNGVVV